MINATKTMLQKESSSKIHKFNMRASCGKKVFAVSMNCNLSHKCVKETLRTGKAFKRQS